MQDSCVLLCSSPAWTGRRGVYFHLRPLRRREHEYFEPVFPGRPQSHSDGVHYVVMCVTPFEVRHVVVQRVSVEVVLLAADVSGWE